MKGSRPNTRSGNGRQPLIEVPVERYSHGARRPIQMALLKLQVQEALRLAQRAMNGLVVALARPGFRIAPLIDADEPRVLAARNNLPKFSGHSSPSARERGTQPAHWVSERSGFVGV